MDKREEERLRHLIRMELENRSNLRESADSETHRRHADSGTSEERKRIIDEEIRRYYSGKGNYREYLNDDGEVEWLTAEQITEREGQIPVDMEELEEGQKNVRNRIVLLSVLLFLGLVMMFLALREKSGNIQVVSNEPGATIVLNGVPTEFTTDYTLKGLPAGPHLITLSKYGFESDGLHSVRVNVRPGEDQVVVLQLKRKESKPATDHAGQE